MHWYSTQKKNKSPNIYTGLSERSNDYKTIKNYASIHHDSYLIHMVSEINLSCRHK